MFVIYYEYFALLKKERLLNRVGLEGMQMDDGVQHQRHSYIDSTNVLDLPRGPLCLHGSLESQDNLCRNVAHAALHRPNVSPETLLETCGMAHRHSRELDIKSKFFLDPHLEFSLVLETERSPLTYTIPMSHIDFISYPIFSRFYNVSISFTDLKISN